MYVDIVQNHSCRELSENFNDCVYFDNIFFLFLVNSQDAANEVAFSAGLTHDLTLLHAETVVYDKIYTNIGSSYNATSGVFTCVVPGLYVFQVVCYCVSHIFCLLLIERNLTRPLIRSFQLYTVLLHVFILF